MQTDAEITENATFVLLRCFTCFRKPWVSEHRVFQNICFLFVRYIFSRRTAKALHSVADRAGKLVPPSGAVFEQMQFGQEFPLGAV